MCLFWVQFCSIVPFVTKGTGVTLVKSVPDIGIGEVSSPLERDRIHVSKSFQIAEMIWNKEIQSTKCKVPHLDRNNQLHKCKNRNELTKQQY